MPVGGSRGKTGSSPQLQWYLQLYGCCRTCYVYYCINLSIAIILKNIIVRSIKIKKKYKILIGIVALLIVIRIILPYVVLNYLNKTLANMNGYYGHIEDIDLHLYRGAYVIDEIYINKVQGATKKQTDFFKTKKIDLSVEWSEIFQGALVGELEFDSPVLIFTKDRVELSDVKKDTTEFRELLDDFMPLKVNRFEVFNGNLHYIDKHSKPKVDVSLTQAHILALNLSNVRNEEVELPSTVTATAKVYEGSFDLKMKLNALNKQPTFDLNAEIENTNLVLLNDFFKAYANFDVTRGKFGLYTEMAAKQGKFKGYVKPIIKDLDVVGLQDRQDNFFNRVYEHIIGAAGVLLRNQNKDQVATKINMEGDYKDPQTNIIDAIWEVLKNAFIQALMPSVDNVINTKSVDTTEPKEKKNLFQRIFKSGKDKKDKNK